MEGFEKVQDFRKRFEKRAKKTTLTPLAVAGMARVPLGDADMQFSLVHAARALLRRVPIARRIKRSLKRRFHPAPPPAVLQDPSFLDRKQQKLERIRSLLRTDLAFEEEANYYDFLSDDFRQQFRISDTDNVSANEYDEHAHAIREEFADGWILDCGAGLRPVYYDNIVNFEICSYPTTDVRGVGERLPFKSNMFDAAFSFAVLEHVRDPFACAKEIVRVLKPGGKLYCVVPFLQPLHGYPHHYFNMTHEGLRSLFEDQMIIDRQAVIPSGLPIWTLSWFLNRWLAQLPPAARAEFAKLSIGDLTSDARTYFDRSFVRKLPHEGNFELASTTALFATKKA